MKYFSAKQFRKKYLHLFHPNIKDGINANDIDRFSEKGI